MTTGEATRVALRPAEDGDHAFLARVYASTREAELAAVPFTAEQKATFLEQQFAAQSRHFATYVDTSFDVVLVDGEPAGRLIVGHWPEREHLADIALLPAFRGRGIGTRLLAQVIGEADRRRVPTTIQVDRTNPAQRLYARLGFSPVGPDDDPVHRFLSRPPTLVAQPNTAS